MEQHLLCPLGRAQHRIVRAVQAQITLLNQEIDIRSDLRPVRPAHHAVGGQLVQPELEHPLVPAAPKHPDRHGHPQARAVLPLHPRHGGENFLGFYGDIPLL